MLDKIFLKDYSPELCLKNGHPSIHKGENPNYNIGYWNLFGHPSFFRLTLKGVPK